MRKDARVSPVYLIVCALFLALLAGIPHRAFAQDVPEENADGAQIRPPAPVIPAPESSRPMGISPAIPSVPGLPDLTKRENFSAAMQIIILLTVLSLAPAILLMMTSFTRIVIVLSLLRQAMGTQQLPPNQVLIGLAMFMTFLVMGPTWQRVSSTALEPYLNGQIDQQQALTNANIPVRQFMEHQIDAAGNQRDVDLFTDFAHEPRAKTWDQVSTSALVPAFMISELKTAFLLGFKVYLPFLIIDLVISTVLISMGMMMLPPAMISMPFKLLLFVLVDGWRLVSMSLMGSFVS
ncbi:MAG TPA: flagellar type III secretion system pore protein FliP [Tepidisphaeraceae bacterium]|nr:flagellar type III secretion system pore protein FliP [Tepidisphaeraceae bacterium]